jgi:hypothetical protein
VVLGTLPGGRRALLAVLLARAPGTGILNEAQVIALEVGVHLKPLVTREVLGAQGQKDVRLLVDHLVGTGEDLLGPLAPGLVLPPCAEKGAQLGTDLVIDAPHHVRGAGVPVAHLEHGVEEVALLGVVNAQLGEGAQFVCGRWRSKCRAYAGYLCGDCLVLEGEDVHGVTGEVGEEPRVEVARTLRERAHDRFLRVGDLLLAGGAVEEGGVDVAEALDVADLGAALNEALLGAGNLSGVDVAEVCDKVRAHVLEGLAGREASDIALKELRAARLVEPFDLGAERGACLRRLGGLLNARRLIANARNRKACVLERLDRAVQVDALDGAPLGNGHHAPHRVECCGLGDVREPDACHDLGKVRELLREVVDALGEVKCFAHCCSLSRSREGCPGTPRRGLQAPAAGVVYRKQRIGVRSSELL